MAGPREPDSLPPEVPEEFSAAYRDAYERALAEQPEPPTAVERSPRTTWLAPVALLALVVLLLVGAYVVGLLVAARIG